MSSIIASRPSGVNTPSALATLKRRLSNEWRTLDQRLCNQGYCVGRDVNDFFDVTRNAVAERLCRHCPLQLKKDCYRRAVVGDALQIVGRGGNIAHVASYVAGGLKGAARRPDVKALVDELREAEMDDRLAAEAERKERAQAAAGVSA